MRGLRFSNLHDFVISATHSTEGTHICESCLSQLKSQLADYDLKSSKL